MKFASNNIRLFGYVLFTVFVIGVSIYISVRFSAQTPVPAPASNDPSVTGDYSSQVAAGVPTVSEATTFEFSDVVQSTTIPLTEIPSAFAFLYREKPVSEVSAARLQYSNGNEGYSLTLTYNGLVPDAGLIYFRYLTSAGWQAHSVRWTDAVGLLEAENELWRIWIWHRASGPHRNAVELISEAKR